MIKELWDLAVAQAKMVGGDPNVRYVELLESNIHAVTSLRDAALMKVMDLLMACKASVMFADEKDPAFDLYRKIHQLAIAVLSTPEQDAATEIAQKLATAKAIRLRLTALLSDSGCRSAAVMPDTEMFAALEKLLAAQKGKAPVSGSQ